MRTLTLFQFYNGFVTRRRWALDARSRHGPLFRRGSDAGFGIAVGQDPIARDWQKWDGLARRTEKVLTARLERMA